MRVTAKQDKATGKWSGYVKGERLSSGWGSAWMARYKARNVVSNRGKGGVFGGGYVKGGA